MNRLLLGLKLYSTDTRHAKEAQSLIERGIYSYVELFAVPGSFKDTVTTWRNLGIPFVIHAAHSMKGLNPAKREQWSANRVLADEAKSFADSLGAQRIIFHPGLDGPLDESVRQLRAFDDSRILVENKPREGLNGTICVGWNPEDVSRLMRETGYGFCLDFGHAHCAAVSDGLDSEVFIRSFLALCPTMFHLTDGLASSPTDRHDRYGFGTFPLGDWLSKIPRQSNITNEGGRSIADSLAEAEEDFAFLEAVDHLRTTAPDVEMKRARLLDVDAVFALSNEPDVRAASFSSEPIPYKEHLAWYEKQLQSESGRFFLFYKGETLAAQVRFQRESGSVFTVSVSVSRAFRGTGLAKIAMRAALQSLQGVRSVSRIDAYIKKGNDVSVRYFTALGFREELTCKTADRFLYTLELTG